MLNKNLNLKELDAQSIIEILKSYKPSVGKHYKHPLGFYYYSLYEEGDLKIRLHIWPKSKEKRNPLGPEMPIHNHNWKFESVILTGSITNIIYELAESVNGKSFVYDIECQPHKSILRKRMGQPYKHRVVSKTTYQPWDIYRMEAEILHETVVSDALTATIVKATIIDREYCPISVGKEEMLATYENERIAPEGDNIIQDYIKELISILRKEEDGKKL